MMEANPAYHRHYDDDSDESPYYSTVPFNHEEKNVTEDNPAGFQHDDDKSPYYSTVPFPVRPTSSLYENMSLAGRDSDQRSESSPQRRPVDGRPTHSYTPSVDVSAFRNKHASAALNAPGSAARPPDIVPSSSTPSGLNVIWSTPLSSVVQGTTGMECSQSKQKYSNGFLKNILKGRKSESLKDSSTGGWPRLSTVCEVYANSDTGTGSHKEDQDPSEVHYHTPYEVPNIGGNPLCEEGQSVGSQSDLSCKTQGVKLSSSRGSQLSGDGSGESPSDRGGDRRPNIRSSQSGCGRGVPSNRGDQWSNLSRSQSGSSRSVPSNRGDQWPLLRKTQSGRGRGDPLLGDPRSGNSPAPRMYDPSAETCREPLYPPPSPHSSRSGSSRRPAAGGRGGEGVANRNLLLYSGSNEFPISAARSAHPPTARHHLGPNMSAFSTVDRRGYHDNGMSTLNGRQGKPSGDGGGASWWDYTHQEEEKGERRQRKQEEKKAAVARRAPKKFRCLRAGIFILGVLAIVLCSVALGADNWLGVDGRLGQLESVKYARLGPDYLDHATIQPEAVRAPGGSVTAPSTHFYIDEPGLRVTSVVVSRVGVYTRCIEPRKMATVGVIDAPWSGDRSSCQTEDVFECPVVIVRGAGGVVEVLSSIIGDVLGSKKVTACIDKSKVCNGELDCPSGHDELGCPPGDCYEGYVPCPGKASLCIHTEQICDGLNDCGMNEEELSCTAESSKSYVKCESGQDVVGSRCNGISDCLDFSDELDCPVFDSGTNSKFFICVNGQIALKSDQCNTPKDGLIPSALQCSDYSDEWDCSSTPAEVATSSVSTQSSTNKLLTSSVEYSRSEGCFSETYSFQNLIKSDLKKVVSSEHYREFILSYEDGAIRTAVAASATIPLILTCLLVTAAILTCFRPFSKSFITARSGGQLKQSQRALPSSYRTGDAFSTHGGTLRRGESMTSAGLATEFDGVITDEGNGIIEEAVPSKVFFAAVCALAILGILFACVEIGYWDLYRRAANSLWTTADYRSGPRALADLKTIQSSGAVLTLSRSYYSMVAAAVTFFCVALLSGIGWRWAGRSQKEADEREMSRAKRVASAASNMAAKDLEMETLARGAPYGDEYRYPTGDYDMSMLRRYGSGHAASGEGYLRAHYSSQGSVSASAVSGGYLPVTNPRAPLMQHGSRRGGRAPRSRPPPPKDIQMSSVLRRGDQTGALTSSQSLPVTGAAAARRGDGSQAEFRPAVIASMPDHPQVHGDDQSSSEDGPRESVGTPSSSSQRLDSPDPGQASFVLGHASSAESSRQHLENEPALTLNLSAQRSSDSGKESSGTLSSQCLAASPVGNRGEGGDLKTGTSQAAGLAAGGAGGEADWPPPPAPSPAVTKKGTHTGGKLPVPLPAGIRKTQAVSHDEGLDDTTQNLRRLHSLRESAL